MERGKGKINKGKEKRREKLFAFVVNFACFVLLSMAIINIITTLELRLELEHTKKIMQHLSASKHNQYKPVSNTTDYIYYSVATEE